MRINLLIFALLISSLGFGQPVLLMHDVKNDKDSDYGPGKTRYGGGMLNYGLIAGPSENDSLNIQYGRSFQLGYGYFYRYQAARFISFGYSTIVNLRSYRIDQKQPKIFASGVSHEKENFYNIDFNVAPFMRLNLSGKRGNHHGVYIDLSAYGSYNFITRHVYRSTAPFPFPNESVKVVNRNLRYINRLEYGGIARFGYRNIILYGQYRLSNHFKSFENNTYPELPRLIVGIAFSA